MIDYIKSFIISCITIMFLSIFINSYIDVEKVDDKIIIFTNSGNILLLFFSYIIMSIFSSVLIL